MHLDRVCRTLRHLRVRESDVPDVAQDVFITIHRLLPSYEPRGRVTTWIYAICINAARQHRRRAHVRRDVSSEFLPEEGAAATQDFELDKKRAEQELHRMLESLDEEKRAVFVLYEIEDLAMPEIAEALSLPLQTAYSRLYAARKQAESFFSAWRSQGKVAL